MATENYAFLTVRRASPASADLLRPERKLFAVNQVFSIDQNLRRGGSVIKLIDASYRGNSKFEIYETLTQYQTAIDSNNTVLPVDANLAVAPNGTTIASTTVLTFYYSVITTATGGTTDAVRLPAVAGRALRVVVNKSTAPIKVFPNAAGEIIRDKTGVNLAAGANVNIPVGEAWHFISNGTVYLTAVDS